MQSNPVQITILRDPYFQFVFDYFHHIGALNKLPKGSDGLQKFLENPELYYKTDSWGHWLAKNDNFFDMGYPNTLKNETIIKSKIKNIIRHWLTI